MADQTFKCPKCKQESTRYYKPKDEVPEVIIEYHSDCDNPALKRVWGCNHSWRVSTGTASSPVK